ncbi:MAG: CPBP family intramembrane glutamic endopeptidase [Thermaerobacterales bacterium]
MKPTEPSAKNRSLSPPEQASQPSSATPAPPPSEPKLLAPIAYTRLKIKAFRQWWRSTSRNPLATAFWLLLIGGLVGIVLVSVFLTRPGVIPPPAAETIRDEVYQFSSLDLRYPHMTVRFGDGYMMPVWRGEQLAGLVVLGSGVYRFAPEGSLALDVRRQTGHHAIEDTVSALYVNMDYREFEEIRFSVEGRSIRSASLAAQGKDFLTRSRREVRGATPFNVTQPLRFSEAATIIQMEGHTFGQVEVIAGSEVQFNFVDLDTSLQVPNPEAPATGSNSPLWEGSALPTVLAVFISVILLLIILIKVMTADLAVLAPQIQADPGTRRGDLLLAFILVAIEGAFVITGDRLQPLAGPPIALYSVFAFVILIRPTGTPHPFRDVGLGPINLLRSLILALLIGGLGFVSVTLALPTSLVDLESLEMIWQGVQAFVGIGLMTELYRRGFLQTLLQRRLGRRTGIVVTALVVSGLFLGPRLMVLDRHVWPGLLLQGLLVLPATEFMFGYLYARTGNIYGGALARGLLEFLPRVLRF